MKTQVDSIVEKLGIGGLSPAEVAQSRSTHGRNEIIDTKNHFLDILKDLVKDPMLILLVIASVIYFITGNTGDGIFMLCAIVIVVGISLFQESRSKKALENLRSLTQPLSRVIRDHKISIIPKEELVVGDYMIVEEGSSVPADGEIIQSNDFTVNESILTGESLSVEKDNTTNRNVFQGTLIARLLFR